MTKKITYAEIDLGIGTLISKKVALIQVKSPDFNTGWNKREVSYYSKDTDLLKFLDGNYRMRRDIVKEQVEKITKLMDFAIAGGSDILCFPTMVIPEEMHNIFEKRSITEDIIIISGFEYIYDQDDGRLNNVTRLYLPKNYPTLSLENMEYKKIYASKYDPKMKTGDRVNIYTNTGFGTFTILNCFDYSNIGILNEIAKRNVNIIFVTSHNPAFRIYHNYATADSHRNYSYIVIVNSGDFGGSGIYAPIRYEGKLRVNNLLQGMKGKGEGVIIQDIDLRDLNTSKKKTIHGWMDPPDTRPLKNEIGRAKTIDLKQIDLKQKLKKEKVIIKLVELSTPDVKEYQENNWKFKIEHQNKTKIEIEKILDELRNEEVDFLIFPEVSLPDKVEIDELLCNFSKKENLYIMGGFEYNSETQNVCKIFTPHRPDECDFLEYKDILYGHGSDVHYYKYTKLFRSKYDHPSMKCGNKLLIFKNSLFGDFAPIICFDYSHTSILEKISNEIDLLFVVSYNPDVETYHNYGQADCHRLYCYIAQCNIPIFGGSAVYAPISNIKKVRTNSILGQLIGYSEKRRILTVEAEVKSLKDEDTKSQNIRFFSPPAGY